MSGLGDFLTAVAPALEELARELFMTHDGNIQEAREHINEWTTVLRVGREEVDAAARKKFGGR